MEIIAACSGSSIMDSVGKQIYDFFNPFSCEIKKIANFEWNYTLELLNCSVYKLRNGLHPKISLIQYPGNFYKLDF